MMPGSCAHLSRWIPPNERARAMTFLGVGAAAGALAAYCLAPGLAVTLGWRNVWRLFGAVGLLLAGLWFALVTDDPIDDGAATDCSNVEVDVLLEKDKEKETSSGSGLKELRTALPLLCSTRAIAVYVAHMGMVCISRITTCSRAAL